MSTVTFTKKDHIKDYEIFSSSNGYEIYYSGGNNIQTKTLIKTAILNNLYRDGWNLMPWYLDILINNEDNVDLALIAKEQKYSKTINSEEVLGVIISRGDIKNKTRETMFFIKREFRRKGLATILVQFYKYKGVEPGHGTAGIKGSGEFFEKNKLPYRGKNK